MLATDDADAFKTVADGPGLEHQVCKSHVKRNTEALIENLTKAATGTFAHYRHDPNDPNSLSHNAVFALCEDSEMGCSIHAGGPAPGRPGPGKLSVGWPRCHVAH